MPRHPTTPAPFTAVREGATRALVRRGSEAEQWLHWPLAAEGLARKEGARSNPADHVTGGRVPHAVITLADGTRAVVREYRRGGMMRHLNRARYFVGERAMEELRATERAREAGARVPEVLAAVERRQRVGYTAFLATRWVPGAEELAGWLGGRDAEARRGVFGEVGRQVGLLHRGGVGHPDLNLRNFLVAPGDGETLVFVIDFDRARLYDGAVPPPRRRRDLRRFARSARKLRARIAPEEWRALREGYGAEWPFRSDLG
jgi:3-deoxy-D-manno-octulosonic acid kinase